MASHHHQCGREPLPATEFQLGDLQTLEMVSFPVSGQQYNPLTAVHARIEVLASVAAQVIYSVAIAELNLSIMMVSSLFCTYIHQSNFKVL